MLLLENDLLDMDEELAMVLEMAEAEALKPTSFADMQQHPDKLDWWRATEKEYMSSVGKIVEVTPGTPDVKSGPMRYQKGLWLQLMCCAPFRLLSQDFRTRMMEDWRSEYWSKGWSCS